MNVNRVKQRYLQMSNRSRESIINIVLSFGSKGITIITQLMIVPLTINYVNATQYGIWLTLSSIIAWIAFFDFGFGNGMRNKVAEANAKGDIELARQYVSTTYFSIGAIVLFLLVFLQVLNLFISWPSILNVDISYTEEFNSLLTANQKPGIASCIGVIGQILSLLVIFLLTKVSDGSLVRLATYYSGIPTIVVLIVSAYAFSFTSYKRYAPHIKFVRKGLIKDIMSIGWRILSKLTPS